MTKRDWLKKSSVAVMLSTSLLMFAEGGQAIQAATNAQEATKAEQVVKLAHSLVGKDYKYGAEGPSAFGTSGFVTYILGQVGLDMKDSMQTLFKAGTAVKHANLQPGDLVFFSSNGAKQPNYVGIYVGDNTFIYSSQGKDEVIKKSLSSVEKDLVGARRLLEPTAQVDDDEETPVDPTPVPEPKPDTSATVKTIGDKVIEAGLKYLGTPYEYGSTRSNKKTMDCSEFVMWAYRDAGINLKATSSRSQATYVKDHGTPVYNVDDLQKGDLIFMMSYRGYKKSDYNGIDRSKQRITHVGIYMGDGKILHTYSKKAGGVKITKFNDTSWEYRFVMGGRPY